MINTRYNSQLGHRIESLTSETRILLQLLTDWTHGDATKAQIYDGYANLSTAFIACLYAFKEQGVDMSEARVTLQQILVKLDHMLSTEEVLKAREAYLPTIQSSVQLLLQDLRAKRRESYQLSRARKRESLNSNAGSITSTFIETERAKALQCLNGVGVHKELGAQYSEPDMLSRSDSEDSSITKVSETHTSRSLDNLACDHEGKYICSSCGTVCIEPIQDAVDSVASTSLELKNLLQKWRIDPVLAANLHLLCMRVCQDYNAAVEVFSNKGAHIGDLNSAVQELKNAVSKAAHFPYRCGHDDLRDRILLDACGRVEELNRGLKSRQRKYMLKHAPAIKPSVIQLLSCLKSLGDVLTHWSHRRVRRDCVNTARVLLDCAFKAVVSAFYAHGVDISELPASAQSLSISLHSLLSEEPSLGNWQRHQPALGSAVKNILRVILKKNTDDQLLVEVWWSVVLPKDSTEVAPESIVDALEHNKDDASLGAAPPIITKLEAQSAGAPQSSSLAPTQGHNMVNIDFWGPMFKRFAVQDARRVASASIFPTSIVCEEKPHVDLLANSSPIDPLINSQTKRGAIGTTLRRMSGRISSMFNLRDVKGGGRYTSLHA